MPSVRLTYVAVGLVVLMLGSAAPFCVDTCRAESGPGIVRGEPLPPSHPASSAAVGPAAPPHPDPIAPMSLPSASSLAFPEALDRGCDVVLLVEGSEAMARADPSGYWRGALKLFISLLDDEDRVGIISFGREATERIPLTQNIEQNHPALFNAIERISAEGTAADIYDAALKGFGELRTSARRSRILVLLAGGGPAAGSEQQAATARAGFMRLLPELRKAHIRMYTLAAAGQSDRALLESAARETGGFFRSARADRNIHELLAGVFEDIKKPDILPFEAGSFIVDRDVREAVIVAARDPGAAVTLAGPAGRKETAARHSGKTAWYSSAIYDIITLRKPAAGSWRADMAPEGSRIFIATDLNLQASLDKAVARRGETVTIDAWLEQRGEPVSGKALPESAVFFAAVSGPGGMHETLDMAPRSRLTPTPQTIPGHFSVTIAGSVPGAYRVTITAQDKTFTREKTLLFTTVDDTVTPRSAGNDRRGADGQRSPAPGDEDFSWLVVLLKLGLVNLAAACLAAAIIVVRMLIVKMRTRI